MKQTQKVRIQFPDDKSLILMREASDNRREALRLLCNHYAGKGKLRIISLYTELTSLKKDCKESVTKLHYKDRNNFNGIEKCQRNIK